MASIKSITDVLPLPNSSVTIPRLGFGVYLAEGDKCTKAILEALEVGYRHIDSAQYYKNEQQVGDAIQQSGLKRSEIFVTTKILVAAGSVEKSYESLVQSVTKIDGEDGYVDLFLIHSASMGSKGRKELYLALEKLLENGKTKSIGVSNWGIGHIEELKGYAKVWPPHVNQIELHPFSQQRDIVNYCQKQQIVVQAYCPLVRNRVDEPIVSHIAGNHSKTAAQVLIRYSLQKGWVPLPKSVTPSRIAENANVYDFELTEAEMEHLDKLDKGAKGAIVQAVKNDRVD